LQYSQLDFLLFELLKRYVIFGQIHGFNSLFVNVDSGKYFIATNWKALLQHMEATALRLLNTVIVSFEQAMIPGSSFISQVIIDHL
jgi:hypothetical protein